MYKTSFKAKVIHASKDQRDKFYIVGYADDKYDYKNYIILQKPFDLNKDEDPDAEGNGIFCECNGDICYNGVKSAVLSKESFVIEVKDSVITIDTTEVKTSKKFISYLREILGELVLDDKLNLLSD